MTAASALPFVADFERVAAMLPGAQSPSIARLRRDALQRFAVAGLPTRRDEDWKYTSLAPLEERSFTAVPASADLGAAVDLDPMAFGDLGGHRLVFVNGRFARALSAVGELPPGVGLTTLAETLDRDCSCLDPFVGESRHQTAFAALNTAFMTDGLHLHLARGAVIEEPIHLLFLGTGEGRSIHPRNVIVAETGARATVIEHYVASPGASNFTNAVTLIFAAEDAQIEHYKLQQEANGALHVGAVHASQARDSRFLSHSTAFGAALARTDITTSFDGEGCEATLDGLYVVDGRRFVDHHTLVDHVKACGTSREHYRGVLDGDARGVFNGKIVVHPGAQRTDARQINHNLLLSRGAEIDTKPQLEIYADDVKCTHGATVGQLDPAQLFYLRARGIDAAGARALLTLAFAREAIERIRVAPLRERVERLLLASLAPAEEAMQ